MNQSIGSAQIQAVHSNQLDNHLILLPIKSKSLVFESKNPIELLYRIFSSFLFHLLCFYELRLSPFSLRYSPGVIPTCFLKKRIKFCELLYFRRSEMTLTV